MIEYLTVIGPILIALIVYFVHLETRITKILTDLCWMKKELVRK
jgi:Flp pilus assembly pilin Flp